MAIICPYKSETNTFSIIALGIYIKPLKHDWTRGIDRTQSRNIIIDKKKNNIIYILYLTYKLYYKLFSRVYKARPAA